MSDQRDQFAEHLKFFAELGVAGYRKDAIWAARAEVPADLKVSTTKKDEGSPAADGRSADLQVGRDSGAQLAAIREDIGECVRCKL